jgi:3-oxoacyl-[acyl-carrier protein] reductase
MQPMLPQMFNYDAGVIVKAAPQSQKRSGPGASIHYVAAKGAVVTMTMGVARVFAAQGIRALSISPGPIDTPF